MPTPRARHERQALAVVLLAVIIVGGVVAALLVSKTARIEKQGKGLVKTSCVLVRTIDQGAETQRRTAANALSALRDPRTVWSARLRARRSRRAAIEQERQLRALARDMREGITCPPLSNAEKNGERRQGDRRDSSVARRPEPTGPPERPSPRPPKSPTPAPSPSPRSPGPTASSGPGPLAPPVPASASAVVTVDLPRLNIVRACASPLVAIDCK